MKDRILKIRLDEIYNQLLFSEFPAASSVMGAGAFSRKAAAPVRL
jgi:hypothetical protein